jgi:hypothetical protein
MKDDLYIVLNPTLDPKNLNEKIVSFYVKKETMASLALKRAHALNWTCLLYIISYISQGLGWD